MSMRIKKLQAGFLVEMFPVPLFCPFLPHEEVDSGSVFEVEE